MSPRPPVHVDAPARDAIRRAAEEAAPREGCGLLLGETSAERCSVRRATIARNLVPGEDAFEVDPGAVVTAEDEARRAGLALLGVWHSHPRGPARPSARDRREAHAGWLQILAGERELRAWRIEDGCAREVSIEG